MHRGLFVSSVLLALVSKWVESASDSRMIRKEPDLDEPDTEGEHFAAKKAGQVTASISSTGAAALEGAEQEDSATRAKLVAHLTSFAQMRQNFMDVDRILSELDKEDVVKDGFVQKRVSMEDRIRWLKRQTNLGHKARREMSEMSASKNSTKPVMSLEEARVDKEIQEKNNKIHFKDSIESGGYFGYWSEDRPHELRLDPSNMKVYSYGTYKLKFPHKHKWSVESSFKKLPKVPHRIHRNKNKGGAALLDAESGLELVYVKDIQGYWHQGREVPSELEMIKKRRPLEWQGYLPQDEATKRDEERFFIYPNHTDAISKCLLAFKTTTSKVVKENLRDTLMSLRHDMAVKLKIKPRRDKGRANVRIIRSAGALCGFEVDIDKVTVGALKKAIEEKVKIKPEKQALYYSGKEMFDDDLLNKHIAAGERTIDLLPAHQKNIMNNAKTPAEAKPSSLLATKPSVKSKKSASTKPVTKKPVAAKPAATKPVSTKLASTKPASKQSASTKPAPRKSASRNPTKPALSSSGQKIASEIAKLKLAKPLEKTRAQKAAAATAKKALQEKALAAKAKTRKSGATKGQHEKATAKVAPSLLQETSATEELKPRETSILGEKMAELRKDWQPPVHHAPKRRTLYVREEDGTIHIEKQEIATPNHPLEELAEFGPNAGRDKWVEIDRGIPITVLLEADREEENKDSELLK